MPIRVDEFDLANEPITIWGKVAGYEKQKILIRFHGQPLGWVKFDELEQVIISLEQLKDAISDQIELDMLKVVLGNQEIQDENGEKEYPPISIVVCTRDRTDLLEGCLESLLTLDYPEFEIIVVDNAPSSDATVKLASKLPVRYVCEELPGLNWARNTGINQANYEIIAFIDDDARPDRNWLHEISKAFDQSEVKAVTGYVAPLELETEAQIIFEDIFGGMGHGLLHREIRREILTESELLWASNFGVGANMAFRREVIESIGYFDPALDVGTSSGGGGDIEFLHRLVATGHTLVYTPRALVWHQHRRRMASLRRLVFDNGRSFGAYLLTCIRRGNIHKRAILFFIVWQWIGKWLISRVINRGKFPRSLVLIEIVGATFSPFAYLLSRANAKRLTWLARQREHISFSFPD